MSRARVDTDVAQRKESDVFCLGPQKKLSEDDFKISTTVWQVVLVVRSVVFQTEVIAYGKAGGWESAPCI